MMICGKIGVNAGPAFDFGVKGVWDNTNKQLEAGGAIKVFGGIEVEGQFDWNKCKELFK